MPTRDIIVIGASAGGIEALMELSAQLPPDLPVSIFAVVHLPSEYPSELASILSRSGRLPAVQASPGEIYCPGHIYVAPPDQHMLLERNRIQLWRGPKENRHRPAINALFRSAAVSHGSRVAGVVLSGALDDGTTGLWWVKKHGGVTVVQDPAEARFPEMVYNALEHVEIDHILPIKKMGELFVSLSNGYSAKLASELEQQWKPSDQ